MEKIWIYPQSKETTPFEEQEPTEWFWYEELLDKDSNYASITVLRSRFYQEYNPDNINKHGTEHSNELYTSEDRANEISEIYRAWSDCELEKRFNVWGKVNIDSHPLAKSYVEMDKESAAWISKRDDLLDEATNYASLGVYVRPPVEVITREMRLYQGMSRAFASAIACISSQTEKRGVPLKAVNMPWCRYHTMYENDKSVINELNTIDDYDEYYKKLFIERCLGYSGEPDIENSTLAKNWNIKQGTPCSNSVIIGKWGSWENFVSDALGDNKTGRGKASLWFERWLEFDRWSYKGLEPTSMSYEDCEVVDTLSLRGEDGNKVARKVFGDCFNIQPFLTANNAENREQEKAALLERLINRTELSLDKATKLLETRLNSASETKAREAFAQEVAVTVTNIGDVPDIPAYLKREAS